MNKQPNLGWIYYREAFDVPDEWYTTEADNDLKGEQKEHAEKIYNQLSNRKLPDYRDCQNSLNLPGNEKNEYIEDLVTTYPGLLVGSGYGHEAKLEGELKLGFHFDHTTGLPVIPGSSVKGGLRSVFPNASRSGKEKRKQFLAWLIEDAGIELDIKQLEALEEDIFDKKTSIYNRDIFYDAYPDGSLHPELNGTENPFLGNDYITPHKHDDDPKLDPFTDPTPLQFLKILPGVRFRFQFRLHDGIITAAQKRQLFRRILLTLGIGAKTNVGYGQFLEKEEYQNLIA